MKDKNQLLPKVRIALEEAEKELQSNKIPYIIMSTWRSRATQAAYYLQGRTDLWIVNLVRSTAKDLDDALRPIQPSENGYKITNCDGNSTLSPHQERRAIDIVPMENNNPVWPGLNDPRWRQISDIMKKHGFIWGGAWPNFPDYPHYEMNI